MLMTRLITASIFGTIAAACLAVAPMAGAQSAHPGAPAPPTPPARMTLAADSAAVRQAALDYIEGWYTGDAARMARAVHPELVKRIVVGDSTGARWLGNMGASSLIFATRAGRGTDVPPERRRHDITILDLYGDMASVRVTSAKLVDYMQLGRFEEGWRIVNVLWDLRAESTPKR